jgi:tetratricopeptide (TPR) repeat protein
MSLIDGISICDTGSSDETSQIVNEWKEKHNLPGKVWQTEWRNFGDNRTESFIRCRQIAEENEWSLSDTYALFLDADHVLHIEDDFDKDKLDSVSYSLPQQAGGLHYSNVRLARLDYSWKCRGVTHEFWDGPTSKTINNLWIEDVSDGGCKSDKFERDIQLLTNALQDEEDPVLISRYHFYLGQSYHDVADYEKAIPILRKRIELDGWKDEVYFARIYLADCLKELGRWEEARQEYWNTFLFYPSRCEALSRLSYEASRRNEHDLCVLCALKMSVTAPPSEGLFVCPDDYKDGYRWRADLSVSGYYTGMKFESYEAASEAVLFQSIPCDVKTRLLENMKYYVRKLFDGTETDSVEKKANVIDSKYTVKKLQPLQIYEGDEIQSFYHHPKRNYSSFSDITGFVNVENRWIGVVREFEAHRFIEITQWPEGFEITRVSSPFIFTNFGKEACQEISLNDDTISITWETDGKTFVDSCSISKIEKLLHKVLE